MQAAVVQVIKPCQVSGWLVCSDKRHGDGWYLPRLVGMACAVSKCHLRPASSLFTVHTVLRRLWFLRIWPRATFTEKTSYWRYCLSPGAFSRSQVLLLKRGKVLLSHHPFPNKYVSHRVVKESLPHQQIVFWSEWVERVCCGFKKFSENSHLDSSHFCLLLRYSQVSPQPCPSKAREGTSILQSAYCGRGWKERRWEEICFPSSHFLLYRNLVYI